MTLKIYFNQECLQHTGYFPLSEKPKRLEELHGLFRKMGLPIQATAQAYPNTLSLAHDQRYVRAVNKLCKPRAFGQLGDLLSSVASPHLQYYLRPMQHTFTAARFAAGAVCQAVSDIANGNALRAFCAIRPPGHHAGPSYGEGFCYFNNAAIGAIFAVRKYKLRVAIVDIDHHHGNGTQAIIEMPKGQNILLVSSFFEGCKYAQPEKNAKTCQRTVRIPLPQNSTFSTVAKLYRETAIPALQSFAPDLLIFSAGFDTHKDDPLSHIKMRSQDFGALTELVLTAGGEKCKGRVVSILEGGYEPQALKESVRHHLLALQAK